MSYPSGHMGNSLVWYGVIALLTAALIKRPLTAREAFLIRFLPVMILFCTTVYTGFHWLTDSIAGVLLGLFLTRLMARIPWEALPLPSLRGWNRPAGLTPDS
jgi:membrane-associated phospholipid phosphatase